MKNIFRIFYLDAKRLGTNVVAIVTILGLILIPSLYAWFNILSNWDPYGQESTSQIKIAVASDDCGTTLDGVHVNISENVMSALETNNTIGWVFTDTTQEAIDGVYSGEYYAALIIPEDFSADMISFLSDTLKHPQIYYYCNQKKNAIAPKITDKAKTALKQQVNSTFISTLAKTIIEVTDTAMDSDAMAELGVTEDSSLLDVTIARLQTVYDELDTYDSILDSLISIADMSSNVVSSTQSTVPDLNRSIAKEQSSIDSLQNILNGGFTSLSDVSSTLSDNLTTIQGTLASISSTYASVNGNLNQFNTAIREGRENLVTTKQLLTTLREDIGNTIETLTEIREDEGYDLFTKLLNSDADALGEFLSSPVDIKTEKIYEISNYGSAASPFYTVLSLWVGGLILVALIHVHVRKDSDIPVDAKPYQKFWGRYMTFFAIGQAQTLLVVLGNLLYIRIQCLHPILFWLACSIISQVFTLFMYSLTVAFGNIGEALAIIIMVIQVAGSGGTFPIEVLPRVYQIIYRYLMFPYAMDALRETVGGMYGLYYWKCLAILCTFSILSIFIGLVMRVPFEKMNKLIEKSKEKSGVML